MIDPCKNPTCQFRAGCRLRPAPSPTTGAIDTAPSTEQSRSKHTFWVDGSLGRLEIRGTLTAGCLDEVLKAAEAALDRMEGLLVQLDTGGGNSLAGLRLERFVLTAKQKVPVIAFAYAAISAAVLPALAADRIFLQPNYGIFGGFGSALHACNGSQPETLYSCQTPHKKGWLKLRAPDLLIADAERDVIQGSLDRECEQSLEQASNYLHRPLDGSLRRLLDGRILQPLEAYHSGLVAGVCGLDTVRRNFASI